MSNSKEEQKTIEELKKDIERLTELKEKQNSKLRFIEQLVGIVVPLFVVVVMSLEDYMPKIHFFIEEIDMNKLIYFAVLIMPFIFILFRLSFNKYPGESIQNKNSEAKKSETKLVPSAAGNMVITNNTFSNYTSDESDFMRRIFIHDRAPKSSLELLKRYAESSKVIANNLYSRSSFYLFVGGVIAISGMIFYWYQVSQPHNVTGYERIYQLMPSFGMLLFIELLSWFFLRLHRTAMNEFRYYESIKRNKEENYALMKYVEEKDIKLDIWDLLRHSKFYSGIDKLESGQTTDIIESKKIEKSELELAKDIIQAISNSRKGD